MKKEIVEYLKKIRVIDSEVKEDFSGEKQSFYVVYKQYAYTINFKIYGDYESIHLEHGFETEQIEAGERLYKKAGINYHSFENKECPLCGEKFDLLSLNNCYGLFEDPFAAKEEYESDEDIEDLYEADENEDENDIIEEYKEIILEKLKKHGIKVKPVDIYEEVEDDYLAKFDEEQELEEKIERLGEELFTLLNQIKKNKIITIRFLDGEAVQFDFEENINNEEMRLLLGDARVFGSSVVIRVESGKKLIQNGKEISIDYVAGLLFKPESEGYIEFSAEDTRKAFSSDHKTGESIDPARTDKFVAFSDLFK